MTRKKHTMNAIRIMGMGAVLLAAAPAQSQDRSYTVNASTEATQSTAALLSLALPYFDGTGGTLALHRRRP